MLLDSIHEKFVDRQNSSIMLEVRIVVASGGVDLEEARQSLLELVLESFYSLLHLGDGYICIYIYIQIHQAVHLRSVHSKKKMKRKTDLFNPTPPPSCCTRQR